MLPILQLGPIAIRITGLIVLAAVWVALDLAAREGKRLGLLADQVYNTGMVALLGGLAGARLWYVATYWPIYRANLLEVFSLNPATLSPIGGVLIGLGLAAWQVRRQVLPVRRLLDAAAPALAVLAAGLALANLASGNAYGVPTRLPWAIYLWEDYRHPTQICEILIALAIFAALWHLRHKHHPDGFLFLMFVALYAFARLLVEPLRVTALSG